MDIKVSILAVNPQLLDQQLQAIGADYQGVSTATDNNGSSITVHLADTASQPEQDQATSIVQKHDPTQLTTAQSAAAAATAQMATVSGELGSLITQVTALSKQLSGFTVAADPVAISTALNNLIPAIGQMVAGNVQIMTALQILIQQQGR